MHVAASVRDLLPSLLGMQDPDVVLSDAVAGDDDVDDAAVVALALLSASILLERKAAICGSAVEYWVKARLAGRSKVLLLVTRRWQADY